MKYSELEKAVIKEIDDCLSKTDEKQIEEAVKLISNSKRIFQRKLQNLLQLLIVCHLFR